MSLDPAPAGHADLILVQHAHQHIVTTGYDNREGVFDLHRALSAMLQEHLARRVPLALHISGTLTTALMWHVPAFAGLVRRACEEGLLELIGSAYAQNVMPLFSAEHNRRQLSETLRLYQRHYGVHPENVTCAWVPERVWNTEILGDVFTSPDLPNGGYRTVLLDDRHAYRTNAGATEVSRADFDDESAPAAACRGEYAWRDRPLPGGDGRHLRPFRIAGAENLVVLPLSSELRYALPVNGAAQAERLERVIGCAAALGKGALLTFGDDAERSAGVGPWAPSPWHEQSLAPYAATLESLSADPRVRMRLPSEWLADHPVSTVRPVEPAGFYELVTQQGAGEDYRGFWDAEEWRPYKAELQAVEALLCAPAPGTPVGGLWDAAWQQLMVSSYETAWQEPDASGSYHPAPWAKATANHVREARLLAAAAARADRSERTVYAQVADLDGEGHEEVILCNGAMFLVISPRYGGRIVLACDLTSPGGRVVIGNFADDWNWQEEPHQFLGRGSLGGVLAPAGAVRPGRDRVRPLPRLPAPPAGGTRSTRRAGGRRTRPWIRRGPHRCLGGRCARATGDLGPRGRAGMRTRRLQRHPGRRWFRPRIVACPHERHPAQRVPRPRHRRQRLPGRDGRMSDKNSRKSRRHALHDLKGRLKIPV